jgi:DNA-directed RNA polymerase specialized sigma24 family protein
MPFPWKEFNPKLKQTRIFIDHFFNGFSYEDLAIMFDESVQEAGHSRPKGRS